jgi:hypothetical protein
MRKGNKIMPMTYIYFGKRERERERKSAEESSGDFSPRAIMMNGTYCRHGLLLINKFSDREQESGTSSSEE